MTQIKIQKIPQRIECINKEHPFATGAKDIYDDNLEKPQSQVNQDRIEDIAAEKQRAQQAESTLDGKIAAEKQRAQQAESTLDGKIAAEKQRAESVEGGLNTRLQTVEQLAEISIGGGDAQIATGADFANPDAIKRAKVPTVGAIVDGLNDGIYDVSKRNPTAGPNSDGKFTLEYILDQNNVNTLIPTGWRHGGMTISFVHSSDNKYVQYRLMAQTFSTTVADWQGIDDEPIVGSNNMVKSGGVYNRFIEIEGGNIDIQPLYPGTPTYPRAVVDIKAGTKIVLTKAAEGTTYVAICESEDGQHIYAYLNEAVTVPFNATIIKTSPSVPADLEIYAYGIISGQLEGLKQTIDGEILSTKSELEASIDEINDAISATVEEELVATETISSKVIDPNTGNLVDVGLTAYRVLKYDVSAYIRNKVRINAKTNYGNAYYVIKDLNDVNVLDIMTSPAGSTWTTLDNKELILPNNSVYLYVADKTSDAYANASLLKNKVGAIQIWKGLKWGLIGDSLTDSANRSRTSKYYYEYISEETGIEFINVAKSGSSYGKPQDTGGAFFQQASNLPSDVDVVTIFGSFNGWGVDVIGNIDDTEPTTRYGCINKCINTIHEINPIAQIGIVAPTPWSTDGYNPFVDDNGNNWGETYIERLKEVCKKRGLAFLDLYHESELRPWDASYRAIVYSKDTAGLDGNPAGVHPNEIGHKIIASHFQALLEKLLLH